jgi:sRNA-binding protein
MAKTTTAATTESAVCRCGCGAPVERTFKQGHDQRLISKLAEDLVYGSIWDGKCMGILKGAQVRADIQERINIVRDRVASGISESLASKFANAASRAWELQKSKDERAAAKAERKAALAAKPAKKTTKAEAADAPKPPRKPMNTKPVATNDDVDAEEEKLATVTPLVGPQPGSSIRVRIGKRVRNATVRGMNQSGKVTAVALQNGKTEVVKTEGQFEVVS